MADPTFVRYTPADPVVAVLAVFVAVAVAAAADVAVVVLADDACGGGVADVGPEVVSHSVDTVVCPVVVAGPAV